MSSVTDGLLMSLVSVGSTNSLYGREAYAMSDDEDEEYEGTTGGESPSKLQQMVRNLTEKKKEKVWRGYGVVTQ